MIYILLAGIFIGMNILVYNHARSMLVFTEKGNITPKPEDLSFWEKIRVLITGINIPKPQNEITPAAIDLPYETHYISVNKTVTLEGWFIPHPNSIGSIILFHGYTATKSATLRLATGFHELGYEIFTIDFRGSGGSNQQYTSIGFHEAEDVKAAIHYTRETLGWDAVMLYGQSMGGVAVLKAIHDGMDSPQKIILEGVYDKTLSAVKNRFRLMTLPSTPFAHFLVFWASIILRFNAFSHNPIDYVTEVSCPTLFIHGNHDKRATISQIKRVYENASCEKQFVIFDGIAHESLYDANTQKWANTLKAFL